MAFIEPGDEVVVLEPFFDQYISNIEMAGGVCRYVSLIPPQDGGERTGSAGEWGVDWQGFEDVLKRGEGRVRMVVLNSPHNPVGKVFTRGELERVAELAVRYDFIVLSDEVYDKLYYVPFTRIAALSREMWDRTLTVGSGGKVFYATGWRVGWLIGPEHLIRHVAAAHTRICYSSVSPLQEAVAIGFEEAEGRGFWDESRREMQGKIGRFCEVFDELGLPVSVFMVSSMSVC